MDREFDDRMEIGVDTGGTFTDFVCRKQGGLEWILKVPSTPDDPSRAVLDGLRQILQLADATPDQVTHLRSSRSVAWPAF